VGFDTFRETPKIKGFDVSRLKCQIRGRVARSWAIGRDGSIRDSKALSENLSGIEVVTQHDRIVVTKLKAKEALRKWRSTLQTGWDFLTSC